MPTATDAYDALIAEIRVTENNSAHREAKIARIKSAGRERVEQSFNKAVQRLKFPVLVVDPKDEKKIPRSLCELIERDLYEDKSDQVSACTSDPPFASGRIESND